MKNEKKSQSSSPEVAIQTVQNPASSATVDNIHLSPAELEHARKRTARERWEELKALEADAQAVVKHCAEARGIVAEAHALHRKFKDVVEDMRPELERVRKGFAHLRKGERIMDARNGKEWAAKYLGGVTYDWLGRCLSAKPGKLRLTDGTWVTDKQPPKPKKNPVELTDDEYVEKCVAFIMKTLEPLDPERYQRVTTAIIARVPGSLTV